jgi:putative nucleotidyltransferase with HDIG domain
MAAPTKILIYDEDLGRRNNLVKFLSRKDFTTEEASTFNEAADKLLNDDSFSVTLIRFVPFDSQSLSILHSAKSFNPQLGILVLSDIGNPDMAIELLEKGTVDQIAASDNFATIFSSIRNELSKRQLMQKNQNYLIRLSKYRSEQKEHLRRSLDLEEAYDATLENLMTALDLRDVETFGHSRSVAKYTSVLAQALGITDKESLDNIKKGALLHDVGKIAIPDAILKKNGPLTDMEWEKIKLHPPLGYGLIKEVKLVREIGNIILYHHERYDGTGYPKRLKKDSIPREARIFALADALDAITSHRPYRKRRGFDVAFREIEAGSGTQFDPEVVEAFCAIDLDTWEKIRYETTKILPPMEQMVQASRPPA